MLQRDGCRDSDAARTLPGLETGASLEKSDRLSRAVSRAGYAEGRKVAALDRGADRRKIEMAPHQLDERRIIEQRHRAACECAAGEHGEHPAQAVVRGAQRIGAIDMVDVEIFPHRHKPPHRTPEIS